MQVTLNRTIYLIELCILRIAISKRSEKSVCNITKRFLVVTNLQFKRAEQSIIFAGHVAPPKSDPDDIAIETMNNILGGTFTSRINMNLREDKHWSYGSRSLIVGDRGQRPFIAYAAVQTDKTKESMVESAKGVERHFG